jgi:glucosylglycerol-phosphate synthase
MKSSLVILYHREPYDEVRENGKVYYREKKSPNGILPTLKSFFADAERSTWVAWKQVTPKQLDKFQERMSIDGLGDRCTVRRIPLTSDQVKNFYHVTSKEAFWPILHSFPWQFTYDSSDWENFKQINEMFAEAACEDADDDALFWIHDYNLWLAPYYIRQLKPDAKTAFFHHTPFPSVDIFNILPWRESIVESLLCCDLCGFHIPRYVENFVAVARSLKPVEVTRRVPVDKAFTPYGTALAEPQITTQLRYGDRLINLDAFPVGTDPAKIRAIVETEAAQARVAEIKAELGGNTLIVSAGRVDYVKGVKEMLSAYERLLQRRPEMCGKVNLVVPVAAPATGMKVYRNAQNEIERLVGKINGHFSKMSWTPIILFTSPLTYEELLAMFCAADIALITPLRDGLNLVAKEFVVTHKDMGGVLILSEFAGAAVELPDAILANPYASSQMDSCLDQALDMPVEEQKQRMAKMLKAIERYDVQQWANHLLREAQATVTLGESPNEEPAADDLPDLELVGAK